MGKPKIIVDIDEHGMNADLKIIPDDNPSEELPAESILNSLKKKGIEIEPDKKSIEEVVSNYKKEPKYYEYSGFVTGTPPGKAPPPTLKSSATLINNSQNLEYAQKCRYAYEVEEKGIR
ncbi:MAG: hypothetical protein ACOCSE_04815, partial [Chitinivibrionales bacterium]